MLKYVNKTPTIYVAVAVTWYRKSEIFVIFDNNLEKITKTLWQSNENTLNIKSWFLQLSLVLTAWYCSFDFTSKQIFLLIEHYKLLIFYFKCCSHLYFLKYFHYLNVCSVFFSNGGLKLLHVRMYIKTPTMYVAIT